MGGLHATANRRGQVMSGASVAVEKGGKVAQFQESSTLFTYDRGPDDTIHHRCHDSHTDAIARNVTPPRVAYPL